jgi:hypothetical protein
MKPRLASYTKHETLPRRIVLGSLLVAAVMVWVYRKYSLDLQDLAGYLFVSLCFLAVIVALAALPVWIRARLRKAKPNNRQ